MDDIRKQYLCKGDGCQAALILPVDEDPSYYGWYQGYNTNDIWLWCPRHRQHRLQHSSQCPDDHEVRHHRGNEKLAGRSLRFSGDLQR